MSIGIEQYRMRIGIFRFCQNKTTMLNSFDVFCICFIVTTRNKFTSFRVVFFFHFIKELHSVVQKPVDSDLFKYIYEYNQSVLSNYYCKFDVLFMYYIVYLTIVMSILLIIGCVEINPGPNFTVNENEANASVSSNDLSIRSKFCNLFSSSVSFLHMNILSLAPKLELISAEYENFDVLSFSESWLNDNHSDDSIKLLNY